MAVISDELDPCLLRRSDLILVRIESLHDDAVPGSVELDLHSATVLHNYGMAYQVIASQETSDEVRAGALRYFGFAYQIVTETCDSCKNDLDEATLRRVILIASCVLTSMIF